MNISLAACAPNVSYATSVAAPASDLGAGEYEEAVTTNEVVWAPAGGARLRPWDWPAGSPLADLPMPPGFSRVAAATVGWFIGGYGTAADGTMRPICWDWEFNPTDMLPRGTIGGVIVAADPAGGLEVMGLGGSVVIEGGNGQYRAAFWPHPPVNKIVDLHPARPGYVASSVYAVRCVDGAMRQAGMAVISAARGRAGAHCHAMVWCGTAANAIDLHDLLPAHFLQSTATSIDGAGNISGAAQDAGGVWHKVHWART
jgi:hypothetical protein